MGLTNRRKRSQRRNQPKITIKKEPLDQEILDSIGNPNAWTPEREDIWINELQKLSASEIYKRFPPMKKPPNVRKRAKGSGWGEQIIP